MSLHKLLKLLLLLQLVGRRQPHLLLPHIKHHFLYCGLGLALQILQLGWLGVDLLGVDFGVALNGSGPPAILVFPFAENLV